MGIEKEAFLNLSNVLRHKEIKEASEKEKQKNTKTFKE